MSREGKEVGKVFFEVCGKSKVDYKSHKNYCRAYLVFFFLDRLSFWGFSSLRYWFKANCDAMEKNPLFLLFCVWKHFSSSNIFIFSGFTSSHCLWYNKFAPCLMVCYLFSLTWFCVCLFENIVLVYTDDNIIRENFFPYIKCSFELLLAIYCRSL